MLFKESLCSQYPAVSVRQMRMIDHAAIHEYGIPAEILMENAGYQAARLVQDMYQDGEVSCLCGFGHNGGDGMVVARHLFNAGLPVRILLFGGGRQIPQAVAMNLNIVHKLKIPVLTNPPPSQLAQWVQSSRIIVDALIGVGLTGCIRRETAAVIECLNAAQPQGVVAVDAPSGLQCDTGHILGTCVKATHTMTIGLPKKGFFVAEGPRYTGTLHLAPIFPAMLFP